MKTTALLGVLALGIGIGCTAMTHEVRADFDIRNSELLTEFTTDVPAADDFADATLSLRFIDVRPLRGGAKGSLIVQLQRREGQWAAEGHYAAADYNQRSRHRSVEIESIKLDGDSVRGEVSVIIGPDSPRPRVDGFPHPEDRYRLSFAGTIGDDLLPYQPDTMASMSPWRKDVPRYGGRLIEGSYEGTLTGPMPGGADLEEKSVSGRIDGGMNHAPVPARWGASGNTVVRPAEGGGMKVLARLSPTRVADGHQAHAELRFAEAQDWRQWDGLRITLGAHTRREDAAVGISIKEADGVWYAVDGGAMLTGREASYIVPFKDFRGGTGGTYFLDVDAIDRIQVGVNNPHGVGDVEFTVKKLELVRWGEGFGAPPGEVVSIRVDTDTVVSFNGADEVPKGLFGFHDVGESNPRQPREGEEDYIEHIRMLNPGSLRPLTHVGFGGRRIGAEEAEEIIQQRLAERQEEPDDVFYRRAKAGNAVDKVVWCHTMDLWARPVWMDEGIETTAQRVGAFYSRLAARAWVPGDDYNMLRRLEVWNEPFMWGRHFNMGHMNPPGRKAWEDPTQWGYIPGHVGSLAWAEIFLAAAEGARSVNEHVQLGGPSAPALNSDDYGVLENHVIPILDKTAEELDFITEHHYGGFRQSFAASYEVVTAYMDTRHNRRLPIFNTETNDLGGNSLDKAHYNIEDILACIMVSRDKARGRALHAMWNGYLRDQGEVHAYRIMSTLRGRVLDVETSDAGIMTVAATPEEGELVVFMFNNTNFEREIDLDLGDRAWALSETKQLEGETIVAGERAEDIEGAQVREATGRTELRTIELDDPAEGRMRVAMPSRSALRLTLKLDGYEPGNKRRIEQHFTDVVLGRVKPQEPVSGRIVWRNDGPEGAKAATLRVVTAHVHRGEAVVAINGHRIELPWSTSNRGGAAVVQEIPIDPAILRQDSRIEFRSVNPEQSNGFNVYMASINIER